MRVKSTLLLDMKQRARSQQGILVPGFLPFRLSWTAFTYLDQIVQPHDRVHDAQLRQEACNPTLPTKHRIAQRIAQHLNEQPVCLTQASGGLPESLEISAAIPEAPGM